LRSSAKEKAKKGKVAAVVASKELASGGERAKQLAAQLGEELRHLGGHAEGTAKQHAVLEQSVHASLGGANACADSAELAASLRAAESEVVRIRENTTKAQALDIEATAGKIDQTAQMVSALLENAPPGLFPSEIEQNLRTAHERLAEQAIALEALHGRALASVEAVQAAHQRHRGQVGQRLAAELQRLGRAAEQPLTELRGSLSQQGEVVAQARQRLAEAATVLERPPPQPAPAAAATEAASAEGSTESLLGSIRDVKGFVRSLSGGLEEGSRLLEGRMQRVVEGLLGQVADSAGGRGGGQEARAAPSGSAASAEAKRKQNKKKKGKAGAGPGAGGQDEAEAQGSPAKEDSTQRLDARAEARPTSQEASSGAALAGSELLQELTSLKSEAAALQARLAERQQQQAPAQCQPAQAAEEPVRAAPKARKKKMFA